MLAIFAIGHTSGREQLELSTGMATNNQSRRFTYSLAPALPDILLITQSYSEGA